MFTLSLRSAGFILLSLLLPILAQAQTYSHSRSYSWGMERGNLVPNWSFENNLHGWSTAAHAGFTVDPHYKAATVSEGGSFVGRVTGTSTGSGTHERLATSMLPLEPGVYYTLSFYYTASSLAGSTWPEIWIFRDRATRITTIPGSTYAAAGGFTLQTLNFYAPDDAAYGMVIMAVSDGASQGGSFQFDNVILEEGWFSAADVASNRTRIAHSVSFGDHLGRSHQTHTRVGAGKYRVSGTAFEEFARPESTFLPVAVNSTAPAYITDLATRARNLYNGTGGVPNSQGFPFTELRYANEPAPRVVTEGAPGDTFRVGSNHETKQGFFYLGSFQTQAIPANIESPATDNAQRDYRVDWTRDADSNFTLTWTDRLGRVAQTAQNITRGGTSAANWTYSIQQYEFYPDGRLKRVRTPLDVQSGNLKFAEITEYNTLGQVVSTYTKNSGLTRFWYNRRGQLRYSQDSGQKVMGEFAYRDYDSQGRLFSQGIQLLPSMTQVNADMDYYNGGTKEEQVGFIYDDYDQIAVRLGYGLDVIQPYHYYMDKRFGHGRLICRYNRNKDGLAPGFSDLDKLVAEFYGYNDNGDLAVQLLSAHPVRDPMKKFQDAYFTYDESGRLVETYNYVDASSGTLSTRHRYSYDLLGRVQKVIGLDDKPLAEFAFHDWGDLKHVILGGNGTGTQGTKVEYFYHIRGWIREIKCTNITTGKVTFQEFLGYNGKAVGATQVPTPTKPRFGGQITQKLYSLGRELNSNKPVRLVNYNYDELGRMLAADFRKNSNTDPYNTDETINFGAPLAWNTTSNENDSYFAYDLNGRITGQRSGNVAAADSLRYIYKDGTYKLDSIPGKVNNLVTRRMGWGNFLYDERSRLSWDESKQMEISYGWNNLPTQILVYVNYAPQFQYNYYDAEGILVSNLRQGSLGNSGTHYLRLGKGNSKEWRETYDGNWQVTSTASVTNLFANSQVGRIRSDGAYEFILKDHQGSTMKTVSDLGEPGNNAYDYLAYGDLRKEKETGGSAGSVTGKYTGKEYDERSRLVNFGARWYDGELGLWISPDPANQYLNPYNFNGGDPVNTVDHDGREGCKIATVCVGDGVDRQCDVQTHCDVVDREGRRERIEEALERQDAERRRRIDRQLALQLQENNSPIDDRRLNINLEMTKYEYHNSQFELALSIYVTEVDGQRKITPGKELNYLLAYLGATPDFVLAILNPPESEGLAIPSPLWSGPVKGAPIGRSPFWTATRTATPAQNAYRHFLDHGADFSAKNSVDYVRQTKNFLNAPPTGTLTRIRTNGDVVRYNPGTNTFSVMDKTGAPRTMFKPDPSIHGYPTNLDYFLHGY